MPCSSIIKNSVKIEASNRTLLKKAVTALDWIIVNETPEMLAVRTQEYQTLTIGRSAVIVRAGNEPLVDTLKRAYSTEVVKSTATQYGWRFEQTSDTTFHLVKR